MFIYYSFFYGMSRGRHKKTAARKYFHAAVPINNTRCLGGDSTRQILCIEIVHVQACNALMRQTLDLRQEIAHRH